MRYEEHCRYWTRGISATYYEPGEPAGCTDPRHCAEHWQELARHVSVKDLPEMECPVCHESKKISIGEYAFDDEKEEIVAAPGSMCEECEVASEEDDPWQEQDGTDYLAQADYYEERVAELRRREAA